MVWVLLVKDPEQVAVWGVAWGEAWEGWVGTGPGPAPVESVFALAAELSLVTRCLFLATT